MPLQTANITPSAGALVVTAFGSSANGNATAHTNSIYTNSPSGPLAGQTTPPNVITGGASISAESYKVVSDSTPVNGYAYWAGTTINEGLVVAIASFAPAGAAVFDHIAVTATSPQTAGAAFNVTITGQDSGNSPVNDLGTNTITVSSPSALMEFDWNSDGTYGDNSGTFVSGTGSKTIKARNKKAETTTIAASGGGAITTSPPSVTTTADVFSKLQILAPGETAAPGTATGKTGAPSTRTASIGFNVTVNAVDANWNPVSSTDTIGITSTDGAATLPANAALVAGTKTFAVTLNSVGSFTVTATDVTDGSKTANTSSAIPVQGVPIVWKGDGSANLWDTSALNWTNLSGTAVAFANNNQVTFDNTSTNPVVDITGTVTPNTMTVNSASNYTFGSTSSGSIGGATGLTKSGTGMLTLSTANTFTGTTTVSGSAGALGGTLTLNNNLALQNSPLAPGGTNVLTLGAGVTTPVFGGLSGGNELNIGNAYITSGYANVTAVTLNVSAGANLTSPIVIANGVSGTTLIKTGAGTQTLTGANIYGGATEVREGTLVEGSTFGGRFPNGTTMILGSGATSGVFQLGTSGGANSQTLAGLTTSGTGTSNAVVGAGSTASTLTLDSTSDITFSGVLGGIGVNQNNLILIKNNINVLTLSGTNTYNGGTTINGGIVRAGNNSAFGTNTLTLKNTDTTLELANGINISCPLSIDTAGNRKLIQQQPGATSGEYSGTITINEGGAGNFAVTNGSGQTLTVSGAVGGPANAGLTKLGAGTVILSGANTNGGDITVSGGTLALSGGGTLASAPNIIVASGAGFDVSAPTTALTLGSGQTLKASATGGNTTATITVGSSKNLTLGGTTTGLAFTAYGGGATAPLTVAGTGGSLDLNGKPVTVTTTAALAAGTYKLIAKSGSATVTGTPGTLTVNGSGVVSGATPTLQVLSGELYLYVPGISTSGSLSALTTTYGTASGSSSLTVSGTGLTANITATRPNSNFEVSSDNSTWGSTATFTTSGGSASGTLYVRLAATAPVSGTYDSQNTGLSSTGASNVNVATAASGNIVSKANATVTVTPYSVTYDGSAHTATVTVISGVNGENNVTVGTVSLSTTHTNAGIYSGDSWNFTGTANYNDISATTITNTITPAPASVTADAKTKTYGDVNPGLTAVTNGAVNGDVINVTIATDATQYSAVGVSNITVTLGSNPNYTVLATNSTLTIGARAASVTADAKTKTYGDVNPALTATEAGTVNGDLLSYTLATDAAQFSSVGVSNITVTLGSNPNYSISATNSTLTIGAKAASVTANNSSKNYGQTLIFAGTEFTSSGLVGGDSVTSVALTSSGATNTAGVGTYPIVASAAAGIGLGNYTLSYTNGTLTVNTATPVTVNNPVQLPDGNFQLTFAGGDTGVGYQIQASTDLSNPTWSILATNVATLSGIPSYTDTDATNHPVRFYRTVVP